MGVVVEAETKEKEATVSGHGITAVVQQLLLGVSQRRRRCQRQAPREDGEMPPIPAVTCRAITIR